MILQPENTDSYVLKLIKSISNVKYYTILVIVKAIFENYTKIMLNTGLCIKIADILLLKNHRFATLYKNVDFYDINIYYTKIDIF